MHRPLALVALAAVALVALFEGCGGRIAELPIDAGVDAEPPVLEAGIDATDAGYEAEADAPFDAWDGADAWDGFYDPYAEPPDPYDAAAFPPCIDTTGDSGPGAPSDVYPAFHPAMPVVIPAGGPALAAPVVVAITWTGDPLAPQIEAFLSGLGGSSYWATFAPAYGIAPPTVIPVHIDDPFTSVMTDGMIEELITRKLVSAPPTLPTPAGDPLYVVFVPEGVAVKPQGVGHWGPYSCAPYHAMTIIPGRPTVPYAVIPRCADGPSRFTGLDLVTMRASQEVVASMIDPDPSNPGRAIDQDHYMWSFLTGPDPTDLCSLTTQPNPFQGIPLRPADFPYWVQRQWSNDASQAYHQACQPGEPSDGPFFAAVPVANDDVAVYLDPPNDTAEVHTKGVDLPLKLCRVIEVDLISDQKLEGPITVRAFESGSLYTVCGSCKKPPRLSLQFAWDRQQGYNGERLRLTVAKNGVNPATYDAFFIQATYNGKSYRWPVVLGDSFP